MCVRIVSFLAVENRSDSLVCFIKLFLSDDDYCRYDYCCHRCDVFLCACAKQFFEEEV